MAYHYSVNQSPSTYTLGLYQLITVLLAAGWTKIQDSDGTTYSASGTQVTGGNTGTHGLNNSKAWVLMQSPDGAHQLSFQNSTSGDASWRIKYSPLSAATGGSPSATQTPSLNLEEVVCGSGSDASPGFTIWFGGTEGSTRFNAVASDTAPYQFWANGWPIGGGTPIGGIFYDGVQNAAATEAADQDPHVINVDTSGGGWVSSSLTVSNYNHANQPTANTMLGCNGVSFPFFAPTNGLATDQVNGKDQLRPLEYFFSGAAYKGQTENILWEMTGTSGNSRNLGYLLSLVTVADYIIVGQAAVPWNGSSPLI